MKQYSAVPRMGVVCDNNFILSRTTAILLYKHTYGPIFTFRIFVYVDRDEQVRFYVCWGTDHSSPGSDAGTTISSP